MKKNFAFKLAMLTLVMTMITASLVSGTYSKYVKSVSGSDTARVAKFAFNIKDGSNTLTQSSTTGVFNIFNYIDGGVYNNGTGTKYIAPGTTGSLPLTIENLSEVKVKPTFAISETNTNSIPIYYTIGSGTQRYSSVLTGTYSGGTYANIAQLVEALNSTATALDASSGATAATKTYIINWAWAFTSAGSGQSDASDTSLGIGGTATVNLSVATTVSQQDA